MTEKKGSRSKMFRLTQVAEFIRRLDGKVAVTVVFFSRRWQHFLKNV